MNKKVVALAALFSLCMLLFSCGSDDDNEIDQVWKAYNEKLETQVAVSSSGYKPLKSKSENGSVYWKSINFFEATTKSTPSTKITESETPYITDSVAIRYQGYYLNYDGTEHVFDTTEGDNNAQLSRGRVSNFVDGFTTMLQNMRKGDQVEVCIPYLLGYGSIPKYNSTGTAITIPAYTMLRFRLYLVDIYPDNPGEFD